MPQFILEIPNCEETISNPITLSALTRIIKTYKWYNDFDFKFINLGVSALVAGSEIDLLSQSRREQRLTTDQTVEVEVTERYNEEAVRATPVREKSNKNIFVCDKTKTNMHPIYQQMISNISMKFRFRSRHSAENFRKRVRLASAQSVDGIRIEANYNYTLPYAFIGLLKRIHELMENKHGYGITFGQWLKENFNENLRVLSNQSGGKTVLAMAEKNANVIVLVESPDEIDEKEKEDDADGWTVTMQFNLYYDRPESMRLRFQHIINNQFIGMEIANRFKVLREEMDRFRTNRTQLDALKAGELPVGRNPLSGVSSPSFDDWLPPRISTTYPELLRVLVMVDENDPTNVLDLNQIEEFVITPEALNWIKENKKHVFTYPDDIFLFRVYEWDRIAAQNSFYIDDNMVIRSTVPLNPRSNWHVTLGMCIKPEIIKEDAWSRLEVNRDLLILWSQTIIGKCNYVQRLISRYHTVYRDYSVHTWLEDAPTYDPKQDNSKHVPPAVIREIRQVIDNRIDVCKDNPDPEQANTVQETVEEAPNQRRIINRTRMKTVLGFGVITRREKGAK